MTEVAEKLEVIPEKAGPLVITAGERVLWRGHDLNLTVGQVRIVRLLAMKTDEFISYRDIYDVARNRPGFHAGDGEKGYKTNVRSSVKRIRHKFLLVDSDFDRIENYSAFGYRWRA